MSEIERVAKGEGETTADWFCWRAKFWGTIDQMTRCARCGKHEIKRHDESRYYRDIFKPTFHTLCGQCYEGLPE